MKTTISMIKARNLARSEREGTAYWFGKGETRFFGTKVERGIYEGKGGLFFVTSDGNPRFSAPRRFSVRQAMPDGKIETVGEFHSYKFLEDARDAAKRAAKGE